MFRVLPHRRAHASAPRFAAIPDEVRGGLAVGLAALAVFALGMTSRSLLSAMPVAEAAIQISGSYLPTNDWVDQINNPSAWSGGRYRGGRQRPVSRDEERREREQEEREAREERQRAEREAREERMREERETREEAMSRARELGRERGTYRTVCVRLCDGYFFPISFATTPDRFAADEAACNARCSSGARLYVYPNPGGEPEEMRDVRGQPYTALKNAFLFRTIYVEACTCKPHPWEQASLDRHRAYTERAEKGRRAVAAKVQPAPREIVTQRSVTLPSESRGPRPIEASVAGPPVVLSDMKPPLAVAVPPADDALAAAHRPEGAMLLGVPEVKPPPTPVARTRRADSGPKRDRREASTPPPSPGGRPDWATRAFAGN